MRRFTTISCDLSQKFRSFLEQIKMGNCLVHQQFGLRPRPLDPEDRDERGFAGGGVRADGLAGFGRPTLDIEQIVGDLEGEAEIVRIAAQRDAQFGRRFRQDRPGLAGERDQRAGLHPLQPGDRADVERLALGDQVDHLAADHAGGAGRARQRGNQFATHRRVAMRVGMSQHLERHRQQPVAGKDCGGFVELFVAGRPAAPQVAVVHRRQVIVDQRIGMNHLDRRRDLQGAAPDHPEQPRSGEHQQRPQPLAGSQRRISHCIIYPGFETGRCGEQPFEQRIGQPGGNRRRLGNGSAVGPQILGHVASRTSLIARCIPVNRASPARL